MGHQLQLENLSPEVILMVMKSLSTFSDLNSLNRTSLYFNLVFKSNEYGICESITKSQFCDTWDEFRKLLHHGQQRMGPPCDASSTPLPTTTPLCTATAPPTLSSIFDSNSLFPSTPPARTPTPFYFPATWPSSRRRRRRSGSPTPSKRPPIPLLSITEAEEDGKHHDHGKCNKQTGPGILQGGKGIGLAEASKILRFVRRRKEWHDLVLRYVRYDYSYLRMDDVPDCGIDVDTYYLTLSLEDTIRVDRAILRYYLLILGCVPDWVAERKVYDLLFMGYKLLPSISSPKAAIQRLSQGENLERKRRHAESFLQYKKQDLIDIYIVCKAISGPKSQMPGTKEQGGDHPFLKWRATDDSCVQQEAELHIKRVFRMTGGDVTDLNLPNAFFLSNTGPLPELQVCDEFWV